MGCPSWTCADCAKLRARWSFPYRKVDDVHEVRRSLATKSLDDLADWMAEHGSSAAETGHAEFMRRQTLLQTESTQADKDTARSTQRSATYMAVSVIVLAFSSVSTAGITFMQWREAHSQLTYSMKPLVDFDTEDDGDEPPVGIAIENIGTGPAKIKSITYYVDRKPVKDYNEAAEYGKLNPDQTTFWDFDTDNDDTLGVGQKYWLFRHRKRGKEDQKELDKFVDFIDHNLAIEVQFCSILGECWKKCSTKDRC
jgi:hypothetical protein